MSMLPLLWSSSPSIFLWQSVKTVIRQVTIVIDEQDRPRFPNFKGNETHVTVHKYCDPPEITRDRQKCLPWKDNWQKVEVIKQVLRNKNLFYRINEKCTGSDELGDKKCTFDEEHFYDFMKLGWAKDTEDGERGICGLIDKPVSECIQFNGTSYLLVECISCPRRCDMKDGWYDRLLKQQPIKSMGLFRGGTKDIPVCSKQFGKDNVKERLNATEAFDFCYNLGCKILIFRTSGSTLTGRAGIKLR